MQSKKGKRVQERLDELEKHLNAIARGQQFSSFWHKVAVEAMSDPALLKELLQYYLPKLKSVEAKVSHEIPQRLIIQMGDTGKQLELGTQETQEQLETTVPCMLPETVPMETELLSERDEDDD